jgi:hypothetical protein
MPCVGAKCNLYAYEKKIEVLKDVGATIEVRKSDSPGALVRVPGETVRKRW